MRTLLLLCLGPGLVCAGEYALFASGSRLHIDRHETDGTTIRMYTGGGTIEMKAAEVRGFEPEEYSQPPALKAQPELPSPAPPAGVQPPSPQSLADAAAEKYGLPRQLVRSVMKAESAFQPQAVSPKGAVGLMQLMPGTAQTLGADAHDPVQNVDAGTRYLRDLLNKYGGALRHALAAYNAGPEAVQKYRGIPPYQETIDYIRRIEKEFKSDSPSGN